MVFTKEQLSGHYNWPPDQGSEIYSGHPTRRTFDRWNGWQVLFIVNCITGSSESYTMNELEKLEEKILDQLPLGVLSEISVYNWLLEKIKTERNN